MPTSAYQTAPSASRQKRQVAGVLFWWKPFHPADVDRLRELVGSGVVKPAIERTYPLDDVVAADKPAVRATIQCLSRAGHPLAERARPDQLLAFVERLPADSPARRCADLVPTPWTTNSFADLPESLDVIGGELLIGCDKDQAI